MGKKKGSIRDKGRNIAGTCSNRNCRGGNRGTTTTDNRATTAATTTTTTTAQSTTLPFKTLTERERMEVLLRVRQHYGGINEEEKKEGRHRLIYGKFEALPPPVLMAVKLYTKWKKYDLITSRMSYDEQINVPPEVVQTALLEQQALQELYDEHNLSDQDMHSYYMEFMRDAAAFDMVIRSLLQSRSPTADQRTIKACSYIIDAMLKVADDSATLKTNRRCLVVECGIGDDEILALTRLSSTSVAKDRKTTNTTETLIQPSQFYGIDISGEMIKHAKESFPLCHFTKSDFLKYHPTDHICHGNTEIMPGDHKNEDKYFDAILLCSIFEMQNTTQVLEKAVSLLRPNGCGTIVLVHTKGARDASDAYYAIPNYLSYLLPTAQELRSFANDHNAKQDMQHPCANATATTETTSGTTSVRLLVEPADAGTRQDLLEGYLAVLQVHVR
jgi:ubiquinone/menaquinone biosynthesis C-methylase UbiE